PILDVPVIGIWKDGVDGVFITPTLDHCRAVVEAGADVLALDGTLRPRPDGRTLAKTVAAVRDEFDGPLMADCDNVESALAAAELGIEIIGTTLAGYTDARERPPAQTWICSQSSPGRCPPPACWSPKGACTPPPMLRRHGLQGR